jgi:hypothetical protein
MTPIRHYFIEVEDVDVLTTTLPNGSTLYLPRRSGDKYRSNRYDGVLSSVPEGSRLSVGETVYVNYQAIDTAEKIDGKYYYIVPEHLIIAKGKDEIKAHKSLIVKPIQGDKLSSALLEIIQYDVEKVSKSEVLSSDIPGYKAGDIITHEHSIDWEFFVEDKVHYYITMINRIIAVNDKLVNDYVELEYQEEYRDVKGIKLRNDRSWSIIAAGEYKGSEAYLEPSRIQLNKYIKIDYIHLIKLHAQSQVSPESLEV